MTDQSPQSGSGAPSPVPDPALTTGTAATGTAATVTEPTVEERLAIAEARAEAADAKLAEAAEQLTQAIKDADPDAVTRYGVYDLTYERFLPGVLDKRPSPAAAKKLVGHDNYEIREV